MNARLETAMQHWRFVAPLLQPALNEKEYADLVCSIISDNNYISGAYFTAYEVDNGPIEVSLIYQS